jgi:putative AlgH/UPF0301 family transcriptional regulator
MDIFNKNGSKVKSGKNSGFNPVKIPNYNLSQLTQGIILVFKPYKQDPRFDKTVILITGKMSNGDILGLVINKTTDKRAFEYVSEQQLDVNVNINWGGPVANEQVFCLFNPKNSVIPKENSISITEEIGIVDDFEQLMQNGSVGKLDTKHVKLFFGAAYWTSDQIINELQVYDGWDQYKVDCIDIFKEDLSDLWERFNPNIPDDLGNILPIIRPNFGHEIHRENKKFIESNSLPEGIEIPDNLKPISRNFTDDLLVHYVQDSDNFRRYLNREFFEQYEGLTTIDLERYSIRNLIHSKSANIQMYQSFNDGIRVTIGEGYESSVIFLEGFFDHIHQHFNEDFVFAIPKIDLLFLQKVSDKDGIESLKKYMVEVFEKGEKEGDSTLLSKSLYLKKIGSTKIELLDTRF